jgi:anti-anti-sigma factor
MNTGESTATVVLRGDLDVYHREEIVGAFPDPIGLTRVVIDCSQVTYIDSTFVSALMAYRRKFVALGLDPLEIVIIAGDQLRRMLEVVGLTRAVTVIKANTGEVMG